MGKIYGENYISCTSCPAQLALHQLPLPSCPGPAAPAQLPRPSCPGLTAPAQVPQPRCPSLAAPTQLPWAQLPRPLLAQLLRLSCHGHSSNFNISIYGKKLLGKLMGKINGKNQWGKFMGRINGTFQHCTLIEKFSQRLRNKSYGDFQWYFFL